MSTPGNDIVTNASPCKLITSKTYRSIDRWIDRQEEEGNGTDQSGGDDGKDDHLEVSKVVVGEELKDSRQHEAGSFPDVDDCGGMSEAYLPYFGEIRLQNEECAAHQRVGPQQCYDQTSFHCKTTSFLST